MLFCGHEQRRAVVHRRRRYICKGEEDLQSTMGCFAPWPGAGHTGGGSQSCTSSHRQTRTHLAGSTDRRISLHPAFSESVFYLPGQFAHWHAGSTQPGKGLTWVDNDERRRLVSYDPKALPARHREGRRERQTLPQGCQQHRGGQASPREASPARHPDPGSWPKKVLAKKSASARALPDFSGCERPPKQNTKNLKPKT